MKKDLIEIIEDLPLSVLNKCEKVVLMLFLLIRNEETKKVQVGLKIIAKSVGYSYSNIKNTINSLEKKQLISVKKYRTKTQGYLPNFYKVQEGNIIKLSKLETPLKPGVTNSKKLKNRGKNVPKKLLKLSTPPMASLSHGPMASLSHGGTPGNALDIYNPILHPRFGLHHNHNLIVERIKNLNLKKTCRSRVPADLQMLVLKYGESRVLEVLTEAQKNQPHLHYAKGWIKHALHERWKFENESDRIEEGKH